MQPVDSSAPMWPSDPPEDALLPAAFEPAATSPAASPAASPAEAAPTGKEMAIERVMWRRKSRVRRRRIVMIGDQMRFGLFVCCVLAITCIRIIEIVMVYARDMVGRL